MRNSSRVKEVFIYIGLFIWLIINLFPVYWMFTFSLKSNPEIFGDNVIGLPKEWLWSNYTKAMNKASETAMELDAQMSKTATNAAVFSDTSRKMNDTMTLYIEKVNASATSTDTLNHQLNDLSKRMTAMNTFYGNMLNAMNIKA